MSVRAKFKVVSIEDFGYLKTVKLNAVYGDGKDNESWSKATPSGTLTMSVTNPEAYDQFIVGKEFYIDFTEALVSK